MNQTETAGHELVDRVQELTTRLEEIGDPDARACADDLATAIVQLYGEGLERIFARVGEDVRERLATDELVGSLMLVHGLYPVDVETRVREALDSVRPYLESHGGDYSPGPPSSSPGRGESRQISMPPRTTRR